MQSCGTFQHHIMDVLRLLRNWTYNTPVQQTPCLVKKKKKKKKKLTQTWRHSGEGKTAA
jgi:hypothetical protein